MIAHFALLVFCLVIHQAKDNRAECEKDPVIETSQLERCTQEQLEADNPVCFESSEFGCICESIIGGPKPNPPLNCTRPLPMWRLFSNGSDSTTMTDVIWIGSHNSACDLLKFQVDRLSGNYIVSDPYNDRMCRIAQAISGLDEGRRKSAIGASDQKLNIWQQLNTGIRYFDLDVDVDQQTNTTRISHCLWGRDLRVVLKQIRDFVDRFRNEIVIVRLSDGIISEEIASRLAQIVTDSFEEVLVRVDEQKWPYRIKDLIDSNRRLFVVAADQFGVFEKLSPPTIHTSSRFCDGSYSDQQNPDSVLDEQLEKAQYFQKDHLNVLHLYCQRSIRDLLILVLSDQMYSEQMETKSKQIITNLLNSNRTIYNLTNVFLVNRVDADLVDLISNAFGKM